MLKLYAIKYKIQIGIPFQSMHYLRIMARVNNDKSTYSSCLITAYCVHLCINPLPTRHAVWRTLCLPFTDQAHRMAHFTPVWLYFIITGFISFASSWDVRYGFIEDYRRYICWSKVSRIAVARPFVWAVVNKLSIATRHCQLCTSYSLHQTSANYTWLGRASYAQEIGIQHLLCRAS